MLRLLGLIMVGCGGCCWDWDWNGEVEEGERGMFPNISLVRLGIGRLFGLEAISELERVEGKLG